MLWITGSLAFIVWLFGTLFLHKGGMWHVILFAALTAFVVQFAQDRRTKEYQRSLRQ